MIFLVKLHKLLNDYINIQDIDLIRTFANDVFSDIESLYGGQYYKSELILDFPLPTEAVDPETGETIRELSLLTNTFISIPSDILRIEKFSCNNYRMKPVDADIFQILKNETSYWWTSLRFYVYHSINHRLYLLSPLPREIVSQYRFEIEAYKKIPRFVTSAVDLPDTYFDILKKGIIAKALSHPKYINLDLAPSYFKIYQESLKSNTWSL